MQYNDYNEASLH